METSCKKQWCSERLFFCLFVSPCVLSSSTTFRAYLTKHATCWWFQFLTSDNWCGILCHVCGFMKMTVPLGTHGSKILPTVNVGDWCNPCIVFTVHPSSTNVSTFKIINRPKVIFLLEFSFDFDTFPPPRVVHAYKITSCRPLWSFFFEQPTWSPFSLVPFSLLLE